MKGQSNIALLIAYDGSEYYGWQKTATGPSVEQTIEKFLYQILQESPPLQAASRTDRGVHAEGQCINFLTSKECLLEELVKSLNRLLPPTIKVKKAFRMPLHFHPTLHAEKKEYHYQICMGDFQLPQNRHYSWHIPHGLNLQEMYEASLYFLGKHDFSSFCNTRKNLNYSDRIRNIENLEMIQITPNQLIFKILGNHFLYKMARNIVGVLVDVGRGKIPLQRISELFLTPCRSRGGVTAPAHGLTLKQIYYSKEFSSYL